MPHNLPTLSLRVEGLFARPYIFEIPAYQRPYSWTMKEAGQLLDDIVAAASLDAPEDALPDYFLGAMVLLDPGHGRPVGNGPIEPRSVEIVDGQQRTITLALLLATLRDLIDDDTELSQRLDHLLVEPPAGGRPATCRIALRKGAGELFAGILLGGGDSDAGDDDGRTASASLTALKDVRDHLDHELGKLDADERRQLTIYVIERCHVVAVISSEIDHAHRLFVVLNERGKPLQRSDILKAEVLAGVAHSQTERAVEIWDRIVLDLGDDMESMLSHLRTMHGHLKPQIIAGVRAVMAECGGGMSFLETELAPTARAYRLIADVAAGRSTIAPEADRLLTYLSRLSGAEWMPAAMLIIRRHGGDVQALTDQLRIVDRLAHNLRLLGTGTGKRVQRFAALTAELRDGPSATSRGTRYALSRDETKKILHNLKDPHVRSAPVCKLLLLRLSDEIAGHLTRIKTGDFTVEHILPQRLPATSEWQAQFPDPRERERWTESIGNLVLVGQAQNDRARNRDFLGKKRIFLQAHSLPTITREALLTDSWNVDTIKEREGRLLGLLYKLLGLEPHGTRKHPTADGPAVASRH